MDAELEKAARRIEVIRHHPGQMLRGNVIAPVSEEGPRLEKQTVSLLDARDRRRADPSRRHVWIADALKHFPEKRVPVFRQGNATTIESRAPSGHEAYNCHGRPF